MGFRVTYVTLTADDSELQASYTAAVAAVRGELGAWHPLWIGDDERFGDRFTTVSPIDTSAQIGHFTVADEDDVDDVVVAARAAFPVWSHTPWQTRCDILDRAADLEEAADLIRYYTHAMRTNDGFDLPMERFSDAEHTRDVMRPYGVWAVIAPFNSRRHWSPVRLVLRSQPATPSSSSHRKWVRTRDTSCIGRW